MTWKGTRRGRTPEGEPYYQHEHPHSHLAGLTVEQQTGRSDLRHEHPHRHHSLRRHRHVEPK